MNIRRLLGDWLLIVAMTAGVALFLLFHNVAALAFVADWYAPHNNNVMPVCMSLVLFTTFCRVDFKALKPVRWHLRAVVVQLALSVLTVWLVRSMNVRGDALILFEAVLVCVVSPCAAAAAVVTARLGGSLEETTSYMFVSNICSALLISLFLPMLPQADGGEVLAFAPLFLRILWRVSCVLLLPMLMAFAVKHGWRRLWRLIMSVPDLSFYLWGGSLVIVSGTTAKNISDSLSEVSLSFLITCAVLSLFVCLVQFAVGRFVGRHLDKAVDCGQALGQKNTATAIWLATVFLHPLAAVGPGCYILWQNIINAVELAAAARREREARIKE
ncbi:MAG: transporter [Prevotella sp.]|nr:transporter [Prevotella sp.]